MKKIVNALEFLDLYEKYSDIKEILERNLPDTTALDDNNRSDTNNTVNTIDQLLKDNLDTQLGDGAKATVGKILEDQQTMQKMMELDKQLNGDYSSPTDISESTPDLFDMGQRWFPRPTGGGDPLILDLDGDGVETINVNSIQRVLFDIDGDGVKTATGWVNTDDGLLVFDRNNNGVIDNGGELFGDQTLINGVKASDGFEALRAEDTNQNGIFDVGDNNFTNVRIWQDVNQNGISESNELFTLEEMNVASINLTPDEAGWTNNGNLQTHIGTYTKIDGTTGDVGNLLFAQESFYRTFADTVPLTEEAKALPTMQGSGLVRDLREAMSMQTTEGTILADIVAQYSSLVTRDEQMAMIDTLLKTWGATSGFKDIATEAAENGYTLTTNMDEQQFAMLSVVEQFTGRHFHRMPWETVSSTTALFGLTVDTDTKTIDITMAPVQLWSIQQAYNELVNSVYGNMAVQTRLSSYIESITMDFNENGLSFDLMPLTAQLNQLQSINPRDALIDLLELVQYAGKNLSMLGWNWSESLQVMIEQIGTQIDVKTMMDELGYLNTNTTNSNHLYDIDGTNIINFSGYGNLVLTGLDGNDSIQSGEKDDLINGGKGDDEIYDYNGSDTYVFNLGDGKDFIHDSSSFGAHNYDTIAFGVGISPENLSVTRENYNLVISIRNTNDSITITDWYMSEQNKIELFSFADGGRLHVSEIEAMFIIRGSDSNDILTGFMEADTIVGGKGNDVIDGQDGNDTYIFNLGDGADTIYDYSTNTENQDTIQFGEGITCDDLEVTRINDDLIIMLRETTDKITINGYFLDIANKIEEFSFVDGTTLNSQQIENMVVLRGSDGNDTISGFMEADTIVGGKGNDVIDGQDGNDTYIFNLGDGQDMIYDNSTNTGNKDIIQFGEGITASMVTISRDQSSLYFTINGTTDKITISSHFDMAEYQIEQVTFTDGTIWNSTVLNSAHFIGSDGNDYISGTDGNDIFEGKKGNDYFDDYNGSDTYIFNLGDGTDTIYDYSTNTGNKDIIRFGTGITSGDLEIVRNGNDLSFSFIGTNDKITVSEWYSAAQYKIEQFSFADGSILTSTQVQKMLTFLGTSYNDALVGTSNSDILKGFAGDDTLNGGTGADKLYGGIGNDTYTVDNIGDSVIENLNEGIDTVKSNQTYTLGANIENLTLTGTVAINATGNTLNNTLVGNSGINTLNGDTGNDILTGGAGADVFVFNTALSSTTNKDTITDFTSGVDKIQLENAIFTKLVTTGALLVDNFATNATGKAIDSNDYIIYNTSTGVLSYDADGTGAGVAVQIALLGTSTHPTIAASSFTVI